MPSPRPLRRPSRAKVRVAWCWLNARWRLPWSQLTRVERHAIRYVRQELALNPSWRPEPDPPPSSRRMASASRSTASSPSANSVW